MRNISTSPFFVPKLRSFPTQFVKHRNRAFAALSVGLLAAQLLLPAAFAQTSNATLNGTVKDPSGAPSSGASVTATNGQTGIQKTVVTDGEGQYSIVNLTPGSYDVQVAQQNSATAVRRNQ